MFEKLVRSSLCIVTLATITLGQYPAFAAEPNTLSAEEKKEGWQLLFDGKSSQHWKKLQKARGERWLEGGER